MTLRSARSFVGVNFPQGRAAFLGGSAASGGATASSDLDILIVLPDEWSSTSFVETTTYEGQLVEAFVYGLRLRCAVNWASSEYC
ncbi:nucleotidyltransferase domain-containing protein [Nesterenkonia ebinurensis]|uniref:nucleotidyltransferase domain-containing protein n=1 Tax=Nesterenkonia ebinurensis TaxID=2608252 RepID=UPI00123D96E0